MHRLTLIIATSLLLISAALSSRAATASFDDWQVMPFTASYTVRVGIARAEAVVSLNALGDDRYEIVSRTRARGVASWFKRGKIYERAVFRYVDGEVLAESLVREDNLSPGDRSCEVYYDPENGTARVVYQGETTTIDMPRDTVNPLLMQIALMQAMARGERPQSFWILDQAGLQEFSVAFGEAGEVETPTGAYPAVAVDLVNPAENTGTRMWAAPDEDWLAVIVEARKDGDVKATLRLSEFVLEARTDPPEA